MQNKKHTFFLVAVLGIMMAVGTVWLILTKFHLGEVEAGNPTTVTIAATQVVNEDGQGYLQTGNSFWVGTGQVVNESYLGLRFENVNIPSNATISDAYLEFTSSSNQWITKTVRIFTENSENPAEFSNNNKPSQRSLYPENVYNSDNINSPKNAKFRMEIDNNLNIKNKSTLNFVIKGENGQWGRKFVYGKQNASTAPKLVIIYETGVVATQVPTTIPSPVPSHTQLPGPTATLAPGVTITNTPIVSHTPTGTVVPTIIVTPTYDPNEPPHATAYGIWTPTAYDTCTKAEHDSYSVIGPDGKKYPTWHPVIHTRSDGSTCTFGHDHGQNPAKAVVMSASNGAPRVVGEVDNPLWETIRRHYAYDANNNGTIENNELATSGIPFGYANEVQSDWAFANGLTIHRHEDHVGHKIEAATQVQVPLSGSPQTYTNYKCTYTIKFHQGVHSRDAFSNNLHEVLYFVKCDDGHEARLTLMQPFGRAGEFTRQCDGEGDRSTIVFTGYSNTNPGFPNGEGSRGVEDRQCILSSFLVPQGQFSPIAYEAWPSSLNITKPGGSRLVYNINLLFDVRDTIRYHYPGQPNNVGYMMAACYEIEPNGDRFRGGNCDYATNYGAKQGITWDSPESGFKGVSRGTYVMPGDFVNAGGPEYWYSDPFGRNAQSSRFIGSIRQYVSPRTTDLAQRFGKFIDPYVINREFDNVPGGSTIHAPN